MPQAAAAPISRKPSKHLPSRRGRRSVAVTDRWVDDALRNCADGNRLLGSPLLGLPDVQRLGRRRSRRSAFTKVRATLSLLQQATHRAAAVLSPRPALAPAGFPPN